MASRSNVKTVPPPDNYPKCPICGWWDRRLRSVGFAVTPEERVAIHMWARHDTPLPEHWFRNPEKEKES